MLPYIDPVVVCRMLGISDSTLRRMVAAGELDGIPTYQRGAKTQWCAEAVWYWMAHRSNPAGCDDVETLLAWADKHPLPDWVVENASRHALVEAGR